MQSDYKVSTTRYGDWAENSIDEPLENIEEQNRLVNFPSCQFRQTHPLPVATTNCIASS